MPAVLEVRDHVHMGELAGLRARHVPQVLVQAIAVGEFVALMDCSGADVPDLAAAACEVDHALVTDDECGFLLSGAVVLVPVGQDVGASQSVHVRRFQAQCGAFHEAGQHRFHAAVGELRFAVDGAHVHLVEALRAEVVADDGRDARPAPLQQALHVLLRVHRLHLRVLRLRR